MSVVVDSVAPAVVLPPAPPRRFTVEEYAEMIAGGIIAEDEPLELLDGWIVEKMPRNPRHDSTVHRCQTALLKARPPDWEVRVQSAVTLAESQPEPDAAVVMGPIERYDQQHPAPEDIGLIVEVSESSLELDRGEKCSIYARNRIPHYWIVNLVERQVEVHSQPTGERGTARFAVRQVYSADDAVPFILGDRSVGSIRVVDLLPS